MKQVCVDRMIAFGQAGFADKLAKRPACRWMCVILRVDTSSVRTRKD